MSAVAAAMLLAAGCSEDDRRAPQRLLDGTAPRAVPGVLDDVGAAVMTEVRDVSSARSPEIAECVTRFGVRPTVRGGERIGVDGRSVTFAVGGHVFACDAAAGAREGRADTCGGAAGKRREGVLTDPRLDLANCVDANGDAVAFAWIESAAQARWLVVEHDGWVEIYEARGGLPVRVATTEGIDGKTSSLRLRVLQYTTDGSKVRSDELEVHVAG